MKKLKMTILALATILIGIGTTKAADITTTDISLKLKENTIFNEGYFSDVDKEFIVNPNSIEIVLKNEDTEIHRSKYTYQNNIITYQYGKKDNPVVGETINDSMLTKAVLEAAYETKGYTTEQINSYFESSDIYNFTLENEGVKITTFDFGNVTGSVDTMQIDMNKISIPGITITQPEQTNNNINQNTNTQSENKTSTTVDNPKTGIKKPLTSGIILILTSIAVIFVNKKSLCKKI